VRAVCAGAGCSCVLLCACFSLSLCSSPVFSSHPDSSLSAASARLPPCGPRRQTHPSGLRPGAMADYEEYGELDDLRVGIWRVRPEHSSNELQVDFDEEQDAPTEGFGEDAAHDGGASMEDEEAVEGFDASRIDDDDGPDLDDGTRYAGELDAPPAETDPAIMRINEEAEAAKRAASEQAAEPELSPPASSSSMPHRPVLHQLRKARSLRTSCLSRARG